MTQPPVVEIVDLLGQVPAEGAIFTTFTLSLAWFEVYLLRHLERNGARRIAVLADPTGIQHSLREGLACGPGLRYALEPVRLPHGFFHPKVAIVWGRGKAAIAVGSGNLTMWGMQRNLEVWDVLLAGYPTAPPENQLSQSVVRDVLGFLRGLSAQLDEGAWSRNVIADAMAALRALLPELPEDNGVRWLDTFQGAIGEQMAVVAGSEGSGRTLQVLSPFHHPEGTSVRELARRVGAARLDLLFTRETSFPVAGARSWPEVDFRTLQLEEHERPLHAKVFHLRDEDRSLLVSGSANATHQALWTTDNVEVCLLRQGRPDAFDALLTATPAEPVQGSPDRFERDRVWISIDWARASEEGVHMKLSCHGDPPPTVQLAYIEHDDEPVEVAWPNGPIKLPLPRTFDPMRPVPTRIEAVVSVGETRHVARAWVSFEGWLDASPQWRRTVTAWSRLLRNEPGATDEEDAELLRVFGEEHSQTMLLLGSSRSWTRRGSGDRGRDRSEVPVPVALLEAAATLDWSANHNSANVELSGSQIDAVGAAMMAAFRVLDHPNQVDTGDGELSEEGGGGTKSAAPGLPVSVREALEGFERKFVSACSHLTARPQQPSQILAYAGLCTRLALRYRSRDNDGLVGVWNSVDRMVRAVLAQRREGPPVLSLLQDAKAHPPEEILAQYAALLALLHWRDQGGRFDGEPSDTTARPLRGEGLREALATLERFVGGLEPAPVLPIALAHVFPQGALALTDALEDLRKIEAPSEHARWLKWSVYRLHQGQHSLAEISSMARERRPPAGLNHDERSMLQGVELRRVPRFVEPWLEACTDCQQVLSALTRSSLLARRVARCTNTRCNRWLLPSEAT